jgi:C2 domain
MNWCIITDPFVRVALISGGKRVKKKRTSTKRNTLNPAWNEAVVFNLHGKELFASGSFGSSSTSTANAAAAGGGNYSALSSTMAGPGLSTTGSSATGIPPSLAAIQLEMTVFNENLLGTNEPLGRVTVGDQVAAYAAGQSHWAELLAVRNAPARWHLLQHVHSTGD